MVRSARLILLSLLLAVGLAAPAAAKPVPTSCVVTPASAGAGAIVRLDVYAISSKDGGIVAYDTGPTTVQVNALGSWFGSFPSHLWSFLTVQNDPGVHRVTIHTILTRPSGRLIATCVYTAT